MKSASTESRSHPDSPRVTPTTRARIAGGKTATTILGVALCLAAVTETAEAGPNNAAATSPTFRQSLGVLLANSTMRIDRIASCASMAATPDDKTVGDYLAGFLSFQAQPGTTNSITYTAVPNLPKNPTGWQVDLVFRTTDNASGDPSSNGFRFLVKGPANTFDRPSMQCIGTG